ncbi:hypothetical protein BsWGS_00063 [Bradybaena similaris]
MWWIQIPGNWFRLGFPLLFLLGCVGAEMDESDVHQNRLYHDLFVASSYNNLIRPVVDTNTSLQINFSLALSAIINVDSKNQVIITNVWLQMYWRDFQLEWEPTQYGNITEFKMDYRNVWIPDIVLFNNADGNYEVSYKSNCVLHSDGVVNFIPPSIYTSSCNIDVKYFPFDQQKCEMRFGSWTFQGSTLSYQFHYDKSNIILDDYMKNGAWDVINGVGRICNMDDKCDIQVKNPIIIYDLVIRRKTLFYTVNLIIPCFLHALACICVFIVPAATMGKKITLVINVLVSLVVLLVLLQKILPPSMQIPLVAKYFIFTFIMNVLEIFVAIVIIYAHKMTPRMAIMPNWMCWLFLYKLPKYLFMTRPDHDNRWQPKTFTPPPSYPNTPQVARANIFMRLNAGESRRVRPKISTGVPANLNAREAQRILEWRQQFIQSHSADQSGATMSSSTSGSSFSLGDDPTYEMQGFEPSNLPSNGHHCFVRDSAINQSEQSLDYGKNPQDSAEFDDTPITRSSPLVLTKEIYSACNAIKFICHQARNKDDYNTVLDDWKFLAAVVDRLLTIIFVLVSLSGTLGVLLNAPSILGTEN